MRRAIVACVAVSSTMRDVPAGACADRPAGRQRSAARCTSSLVILPPGPLPATSWSERPSSTAVRRATGVAFGARAGRGEPFVALWAGVCSTEAGPPSP